MRLIPVNIHAAIIVLLLLCTGLIVPYGVAAAEPLVVAYRFDSEPIQFTSNSGKADGILIDIWRLWSEKSGRAVRFVEGSNKETQEMMRQGQVDVIAGLFSNERRARFLDFSDAIIGSPYHVFYNSKINTLKSTNDLMNFRVAVTRGSYHEDYMREHFPEVQLILFDGYGAMFSAADKGEVDVFVTQPLYMQRHQVSGSAKKSYSSMQPPMYTRPYKVAVHKNDTELLHFIQRYMDKITAEEKAAISNKWIGVKWAEAPLVPQLQLTTAERDWLNTHKTIRLGVDPAWPPFEYIDEDGEHTGLGADFMNLFNQQLKLDLQPVKNLRWSQVIENTKQGKIDLLPTVTATLERKQYLNFTKPYLVYPFVIFVHEDARFVTSLDDLNGKNVAVEKAYVTENLLREKYSAINVKTYETTKSAFLALSQGEVDAYFGNLSAGMWTIDKLGLANVKVAAPTPYNFEQSIAVRKDWPELVNILNKVIDNVSVEQRQEIKNRWFEVGFDYQVDNTALWRVAIIIIAIALVIILLMLYWNRQLQLEFARRHQVEEKLAEAKNAIIQAAEEQFNNLTEGSIQGVWIHIDWNPVFSNQALATMLGFDSVDELLALPSIESCIAAHDRGRLRGYRKARKAGKTPPEQYEFDAVRKDGKVITLDAIVRQVKWKGAYAYQSTMVDVTARKEIEKQLMEEKLLAESMIDSLPGSFFMLDKEVNLLHWNRNLELIHGLNAEQLSKMKGYDLIHPHHRHLAEKSLHKVMSEGASTIELDVKVASGEAVPFLISAVRTQIGSHTRIIGVAFDVSQQHKIEQKLRKSEIGLAEAQRIAHMGNWAWNLKTNAVFWADEVFRIFGYAPDAFEPDADSFARHIHPGDHGLVMRAAKEAISGGSPSTLDFRILREDKVERTVRVDSRIELTEDGETKRLIGVIQDITDSKQVEQKLAERERQFRDLIEGSIQGIVILRDNRALFANQAMANILGLESAKTLTAMNDVMSLVAPYHHKRVLKYTHAWIEQDKNLLNSYEFDALRADGSIITLENIGRRVRWQGKTALQCTYVDITERRKAEDALRSSQTSLLETQRIAHLGSWVWLFDSQQMYWTDEAYRLFGYSPGEVEPGYAAFIARVHPDDLAVMKQTIKEAVVKHHAYKIEFRAVMPDKQEKHIYAFGDIVTDENGQARKLIGTVQDITNRKQAERSRELEFTNIKLQELDELKSMFIASMSHELRTPLNSIIGFTGVLLQGLAGPLSTEQTDQLQRVYSSGKHLLALITDVIDISKIEAGRLDVYGEDVDICVLINEAIETVKPDVEKIGLTINFVHEASCVVLTDKKRCYQCVLNLVSNAVKYSEHGQIDISIEDTEDTLCIIVKDNGIGISNNDLKNLFAPFERVDSHLKVVRGGTGLGLYLTKKMAIELLGGNVVAESVQGKGSTFTLSLAKAIDASGYAEITQQESHQDHSKEFQINSSNAKTHSEDAHRLNTETLCHDKLAFIASMSHELRTPLNSIIGFSGILNKGMVGVLTEQQNDQVNRIHKASLQLLQQVSGVIDLAKIGIEDLSSAVTNFVLNDVVNEAIATVNIAAQDKHLPIEINVPEGIEMYADQNRLKQCLVHLLDNAVRYTEHGQIELNATVVDELLHLEIIDTAESASDDWMQDAQKLVGKSVVSQGVGQQHKVQAGSGLSLYLVRYITTHILNGELQFRKRENGGTSAKLVLPMRAY